MLTVNGQLALSADAEAVKAAVPSFDGALLLTDPGEFGDAIEEHSAQCMHLPIIWHYGFRRSAATTDFV